MTLKYCRPFKNAKPNSITQGFHQDHQANDFAGSYGEFLVAPWNAKVLNVRSPEKLDGLIDDLQNGCGIRLQSIEDPTITISYWHCISAGFLVSKGDIVTQGQPVAQMGNTGFVMAGNEIITTDIKLIPPYKGTHVHISMGKTVGDNYTALDYSSFIDWLIPVNYDWFTAVKVVLQKISNLLTNK